MPAKFKVLDSGKTTAASAQVATEATQKSVAPAKASRAEVKIAAEPVNKSGETSKKPAETTNVSFDAQRTAPHQRKQIQTAAMPQRVHPSQLAPLDTRKAPSQVKAIKASVGDVSGTKAPKVDDAVIDEPRARQRQPSEGASDSDFGGVAFQSGYHMSDSPILMSTTDEEEEQLPAEPTRVQREHSAVVSAPVVSAPGATNAKSALKDTVSGTAPFQQPQSVLPTGLKSDTLTSTAKKRSATGKSATPASSDAPVAGPSVPPTAQSGSVESAQGPAAKQVPLISDATRPSAKQQGLKHHLSATVAQADATMSWPAAGQQAPAQGREVVQQRAPHAEAAVSRQDQSQPSGITPAGQKRSTPLGRVAQSPKASDKSSGQQTSRDAAVQGHQQAHKAVHYPVADVTTLTASAGAKSFMPGSKDHPRVISAQAVPAKHATGAAVEMQAPSQGVTKPEERVVAAAATAHKPPATVNNQAVASSSAATVKTAPAQTQQASIAAPIVHKPALAAPALPLPAQQARAPGVAAAIRAGRKIVEPKPLGRGSTLLADHQHQVGKLATETQHNAASGHNVTGRRPDVTASGAADRQASIPSQQQRQGKAACTTPEMFSAAAEPSSPKARPVAAATPPHSKLVPAVTQSSSATQAQPLMSSVATAASTRHMEEAMLQTAQLITDGPGALLSAEANPPLPSSDSGESMDIDEEDGKLAPPLPTDEASLDMLQLATIDSGQDQLAVSTGIPLRDQDRLSEIEASFLEQSKALVHIKQGTACLTLDGSVGIHSLLLACNCSHLHRIAV